MVPRGKLWSRRRALQTLMVGAGGLAFGASADRELKSLSLVGSPVRAALAGAPKRLLVIFSINGVREGNNWRDWVIPGSSETDFTLGDSTQPLARHRDELVFFDKLIFGTRVDWGETHWVGVKAALTAADMVDENDPSRLTGDVGKNKPNGPSIDYYVGEKLGRIATPQWPSLQINLQQRGWGGRVSYDMSGNMLPAYEDPWQLYSRMFSTIPDDGNVTPDPGLLKRVLMRQSVLDSVAKDVAEFRRRLPPEDRERADAQLDAIRTLEQRLQTAAPPTTGCTKPTVGDPFGVNDSKRYPELVSLTSDLVVSAFACDLTRVAMYGLRVSGEHTPSDFDPLNSSHQEHQMSHDYRDEFVRLKTWYMEQVASLIDKLKAIPEGDGTMLDNTLVLWATEISTGHTHNRMPWLTIGGKNLGVNRGRCLDLPVVWENGLPSRSERGYPHGRLMVSILNALGLPDTSFGSQQINTGPMEGFLV